MSTSLFGLEAELAISARKGQTAVPVEDTVRALFDLAGRRLVHLRGEGSRMFLDNGSLFYIDAGSHPEVATPECVTPWQAVSYLRGAERVVANLAAQMCEEHRFDEVLIGRGNVDYLNVTSWGAHESYLTRQPIRRYENWLIPHLVSRIIYTGCGGLDPTSPGIHFSLSPRVSFIDKIRSEGSTSNRGIFHTRDESLSTTGCNRLHILVGDNACSQLSQLLRIGSTALVIALAEGPKGETPLKLKHPLQAMRGFARDIGFRAEVELPGGPRLMSAFDIQHHYLEKIEACADKTLLPEWADRICRMWRGALELVGRDAGRGSAVFDWTLKRDLFDREIARSGHAKETVLVWNAVLQDLRAHWPETDECDVSIELRKIDQLRAEHPAMVCWIDKAGAALAVHGLGWGGLAAFNALRQRLAEIDVRFSLVNDGIFDTLDRRGVLSGHRVVSDEEIGAAIEHAPEESRARLRAEWVKRLAADENRYVCFWEGIRGDENYLDLGDPFATESKWKPRNAARNSAEDEQISTALGLHGQAPGVHAGGYAARGEAFERYRLGRYAEAESLLTRLLESGFEPADIHCHLARLCFVTDNSDGARAHTTQAWAGRDEADSYVVARTLWLQLVLAYLEPETVPGSETGGATDVLIGKLKTALQGGRARMLWHMQPVLNHLEPRLTGDQNVLLAALVKAMSDEGFQELEALESWRAQAPVPLDDA